MGNRQSSTEVADERSVIYKDEDKDGDDEDDSYGVKQYNDVTSEKKNLTLNLPDDDNTDESNNTQSESTASNQSFNRSYGSSTTRTKYGETNSVVTSDYESEGSWSDVGETSKSNTVSKESVLYDTDDQTALTELAHYGDDEGTKHIHQQSKKKRRSKWLKMMNPQDQVLVQNNVDDDEVETVLDCDDDRSLRSMFETMQSKEKTDGDDETTIHIIDADEEYSRCSFNETTHQQVHDVVPSTIQNRPLHPKDVTLDKQTMIINAHVNSSKVIIGELLELPNVQPPRGISETDDMDVKTKDKENGPLDEEKETILLVDGLVGDPVEANASRRAITLPPADVSQGNIVLKESLSSLHNTLKDSSISSTSNLNSTPSKRSDPSGIIVRGTDIPEKNKRKAPRKLLDDVELNPKREEMQRQLLLGISASNSNKQNNQIFFGSTSHSIADKIILIGQSVPATTSKYCEPGAIMGTKQKSSDSVKKSIPKLPIALVQATTNHNENLQHGSTQQDDLFIPTMSPAVLDTPTMPPSTKNTVAVSPQSRLHAIENSYADEKVDEDQRNIRYSTVRDPELLVVQALDVRSDHDAIIDAAKNSVLKLKDMHGESNSNALLIANNESKQRLSRENAVEIDNSVSWQSHNPTPKPIPESSQRLKRFDNHRKSPKSDVATKQKVREGTTGIDAKHNVTNMKEPANVRHAAPAPTLDRSDSELKPVNDKSGNTGTLQFNDVSNISNEHKRLSKESPVMPNSDLNHVSKDPVDEKLGASITDMRDRTIAGPIRANVECDVQGFQSKAVRKIIGQGNRKQLSPSKIKIRPEMCYIEVGSTSAVNPEATLRIEEPIKSTKPTSPKPEKEDEHNRKSVSRQSTNVSSVVEIVDYDEDIDLEVVKQYDDTFNELLQRFPQFMIQNPSLMEIIRVAKLQKILYATLEMERELEDYVQSLRDQKNEVSAHYQKKLLEASRRNAEREYFLQGELDKLKSSVTAKEKNIRWELLSMYKTYCAHCQQVQKNLLFQRLNDGDNPLSLLPKSLSSEKHLLLDALTSVYDGDHFGRATLDSMQSENVALTHEVKVLEKELSRLKQPSEANKDSWVDSVLCSMDSRQFEYLKQVDESRKNNL